MSDETAIGTEGDETPERPEWLPENFKSPEDLAASYKEAERKIHELAAKAKEADTLAEQNRQWQEWAQQQEHTARQQNTGDPRQQFMEVWDDPDRQPELVLHMAQQLADLQQQVQQGQQRGPDPVLTEVTAELAFNKARAEHPDWDDYHDQIAEIVQQNPHILGNAEQTTPTQFAKGLDLAYSIAKGQALANAGGQAVNDAAEAARLAKQQAQTMSGQSARPATQSPDEEYWARVRAAASGGYGDS